MVLTSEYHRLPRTQIDRSNADVYFKLGHSTFPKEFVDRVTQIPWFIPALQGDLAKQMPGLLNGPQPSPFVRKNSWTEGVKKTNQLLRGFSRSQTERKNSARRRTADPVHVVGAPRATGPFKTRKYACRIERLNAPAVEGKEPKNRI